MNKINVRGDTSPAVLRISTYKMVGPRIFVVVTDCSSVVEIESLLLASPH
jgi:hypothetical protein